MFGRDEKVSSIRLTAVQYIILVIFLMLAYGLWRLQVMQSDFYAQLAEKNRIRNVPILAPRGKILDREGRVIVDNYPSFYRAAVARFDARSERRRRRRSRKACISIPRKCASASASSPSMPQYQPILSERRHHAGRTGLHRVAQATNCRNSTPSWRTAACIRATDSWRT